jgi:hypothetical protein
LPSGAARSGELVRGFAAAFNIKIVDSAFYARLKKEPKTSAAFPMIGQPAGKHPR